MGKREGSRSQEKACFWVVAFSPNCGIGEGEGGGGRGGYCRKALQPSQVIIVCGFLSNEEKEGLFTSCEELAKERW